jgi:outer membrane protein OmpA-like peptidoglycan-associated protein/uncharacterized protein YegP (UPF0339 family)
MGHDEYLNCSSYENQPAHETEAGFTAFYDEKSQRYFFALLDAAGKVLLRSEGYPQIAPRENGIQSVIKNRTNRDFYAVKEEDGVFFLTLRAANYREIARSCPCNSETAALELIPFVTGEKIRGEVAKRTNANDDDDYLRCKEYEGHPDVGVDGYAGLVKFSHSNGQHYFAWYDDSNKLLMRSEGYPTIAARNNGMASVAKNRDLEERYAIIEKLSHYFTILKAGNHQEIARSCPYDSEATARALFPSARAEAARLKAEAEAARLKAEAEAARLKAEADAARLKAEAEAEAEAARLKAEADAAAKLQAAALAASAAAAATVSTKSENTEDDYLACRQYDGHGDADENGFVRFQHTNDKFYFTWLDDNGKIKMRSEGYLTAVARDNGINSVIRNRDIKERYVVKEMMGKHFVILKAANHQEIARSCPKDNMDAVGAFFPILGLGAAAGLAGRGMDIGAALSETETPSVKPTVDVEDDYLTCKEYHGHMTAPRDGFRVFISQKTGKYYFAVVDEDDDVALRSEGHLTAKERDADLEDVVKNKFTRERYEIKKVGFDHYFIVLKNAAGKEIGRSCAYDSLNAVYAAAPFLNPAKPDAKVGLGAPLAMALAAAAAAVVPKAAPAPPKVEAKAVAPVAAPIAPAAIEEAAATGSKNWLWWLLLALLALLAWWLFGKGCGKTDSVAVAPPVASQAEVKAMDTVKTVEAAKPAVAAAPETAAAPSCDLNWIFFDFDKAAIRSDAQKELAEMAKILKEHKDYVGVLSAHTDIIGSDAYNEGLSARRATNAKAALVKLGIDADRLQTEKSGKKAPVAKNTTDDNGRHYNRRVELYIRDKAGKDICKSIPPEIPTELKAN